MNEVEDIEEKKGAKPKDVSFKSMIISAVWIGVWTALKAVLPLISGKSLGIEMWEIGLSGFMIGAAFSPVYFSIMLDKVKEMKIGR